MMHNFRRVHDWLRRAKRRGRGRGSLLCEAMEERALMAADPLANLLPPAHGPTVVGVIGTGSSPGTSQATLITTQTDPKLLAALHTFLNDLELALRQPDPSGLTQAALKADLDQVFTLAGVDNEKAVTRLNIDVAAIVAAGSITPVQRLSLIGDLEQILLNAGIPGSVVVSAANQALAPLHGSPSIDGALADEIADPNALGTAQAGQTRGQGGNPPASASNPAVSSSGDALPGSGLLGKSFRTLMDDLKGILGKANTISPARKSAIRSNFAAIAIASHRPDDALATALRQDLDAIVTDGRITADGRARIAHDLAAVLQGAGVPGRLADRTLQDLDPVIRASDLAPIDLRTLLGDLVNLLLARPRARGAR